MRHLVNAFNPKATPQDESIPGRTDQVQNSAGGFVFAVDKWKRLERFLVLGTEGGSYYVSERKLTVDNAKSVAECLKEDGLRVVDAVVDVSHGGRAPKNDSALFVLAMAACPAFASPQVNGYALDALPKVARIGTHLFHFVEFVDNMRGWGRSLRRAVAQWYLAKPVEDAAQQIVKYQSRDGWSHKDLLKLAHPKTDDPVRNQLFHWATESTRTIPSAELPQVVQGFELAKGEHAPKKLVKLIEKYGLTREMLPTESLVLPEIWEALLPGMPANALIRNLGNMSKCGFLAPLSNAIPDVVDKLTAPAYLLRNRVHPMDVLFALKTYASGQGFRGKGTWPVVPQVVDALNEAFYIAFKCVAPTGKRFYLGVDVSGSMGTPIANSNVTCREAAAAVAMVFARTEPMCYAAGFQTDGSYRSNWGRRGTKMIPLPITAKSTLQEITAYTTRLPFGGTDCALPMLDALEKKLDVDVFIVLTDHETWAGSIQPTQALAKYRRERGINAKMVVVGMTATEFTIADPTDSGQLDVVGFDTSVPAVVADFVK